jgi:hypothetical protein
MQVLRVCGGVFICAALLTCLLIALAPNGGVTAPEQPLDASARSYPLPRSDPPPDDPAPWGATPIEQARLHPALRRALQAEGGCGVSRSYAGAIQHPDGSDLVSSSPCFLSIVIERQPSPGATIEAAAIPDRLARRQQVVAQLQSEAQQSSAALSAALAVAIAEG